MSCPLPRFLAIPAKHFFSAARAHAKHEPVLIGGAAIGMHGLLQERFTKDLDINICETKWLIKAFGKPRKAAADSPQQWLLRTPEASGGRCHFKLTWLDPEHAIKVDIAAFDRDEMDFQLKYSALSPDGVRCASIPLLLALKMHSYIERPRGARDPKVASDFTDLEMLVSHIVDKGIIIPEEIKTRLLGPEVIYKLLDALERDRFSPDGETDFMILQWIYEMGAMPDAVASDLLKRRVVTSMMY